MPNMLRYETADMLMTIYWIFFSQLVLQLYPAIYSKFSFVFDSD